TIAFNATVTAQDFFNNTVTGYLGRVHFSTTTNMAMATFSPTDYTFVAGDNGIHQFTNGVTFGRVGTDNITVQECSNMACTMFSTVQGATSVIVASQTLNNFGWSNLPAGNNVSSGVPFNFTLTARDNGPGGG